jgi:hypothetical protein
MAAMTGKALGFLDVFQAFESVLFDGIAREYCLDQLPGGVYAAELVREERRLEQLDDAAFLRLLALTDAVKAQYPDAVIESFLLVGFLNIFDKLNDPEYRLPVARVTVTVGEFQLSRECALSDSWEG